SNMEMVDKVVDTIKSNGIKLSYQSYAAILECLGRKQSVKIGRVCGVLDEMKESKFEIEKLFQHITFSSSQRESIMRAIVAVNPDYKPEGNQLTSICNVPLLENIYRSKESLEEEVEKDASRNNRSGYHCLFDSQQLQKAVRRQINIELGGGMKVKSIESPEILSNDSVKKGRILEEHVEMWRQVLKSSFMSFRTKKTGHKWKMDPFYFVLQPDEYIEVLLNYIPQIASSTEGESLLSASNEIGSRLFKKYDLQHKQKSGLADKISDMYKDYVAATLDDDLMTKYQYREYWQKLDNEGSWGPSLDYEALPWGRGLIILGIKLTELLLKEIKIDVGKITGKKEK
ncbi:DNA-directed RNA polymerase, mitochondrial-like, partial [Saccoglossus kowalevskii]